MGTDHFWTGVGVLYLASVMFSSRCPSSGGLVNSVIGSGTPLPVHSTGMSASDHIRRGQQSQRDQAVRRRTLVEVDAGALYTFATDLAKQLLLGPLVRRARDVLAIPPLAVAIVATRRAAAEASSATTVARPGATAETTAAVPSAHTTSTAATAARPAVTAGRPIAVGGRGVPAAAAAVRDRSRSRSAVTPAVAFAARGLHQIGGLSRTGKRGWCSRSRGCGRSCLAKMRGHVRRLGSVERRRGCVRSKRRSASLLLLRRYKGV